MNFGQSSTVPEVLSLAVSNFHSGRHDVAEEACRHVLAIQPENPIALNILGVIAAQARQLDAAIEFLGRAAAIDPSNADVLNNLGNVLADVGRPTEAEGLFRRAIAANHNHPEAHNGLGNVLKAMGRLDQAESTYREALIANPSNPWVQNNLGVVSLELGRPSAAEQFFRQALLLKLGYAEAHRGLGEALRQLGRRAESEQSIRAALTLNPDYAEAHNDLGADLLGRGLFEEAERCIRLALALKPNDVDALKNLAAVMVAVERPDEAERLLRQALKLRPDSPDVHCHWTHQCQHLCMWSELASQCDLEREFVTVRKSGKITPFSFITLPTSSGREQNECARHYAEASLRHCLSQPPLCGTATRPNRDRLRIGYLSADFREHATSNLLVEILEKHARNRFEVFGYSFGADDGSAMRARIQTAFDTFYDIRDISYELSARQIVDDRIDILIDLNGFTSGGRLEIAALRPAPVQVNWLGYPGTLGTARLADYLIGDPTVTPLDRTGQFSEVLAQMPHCYQPNDRKRQIDPKPARAETGLPDDGFVFCSLNQSYKITPAMFDLWCRLLKQVPGSVLWLLQSSPATQDNLHREAAARGIEPGRLIFAPLLLPSQHLGRLQLADLGVDTYPVTSHTTGSDMLWAGVPFVTLIGETFASRVGASLLRAAGLPELVASDSDSYFSLTLALATQKDRLAQIRSRIAVNRMSCPLFDSEKFTRDLEQLYQRMWSDYSAGRKQPIVLH